MSQSPDLLRRRFPSLKMRGGCLAGIKIFASRSWDENIGQTRASEVSVSWKRSSEEKAGTFRNSTVQER
jgi:hypothetical protein